MPKTDHLKRYQWKPGQSGNPRGRRRAETFEQIVEKILDEKLGALSKQLGLEPTATKREAIARAFVSELMGAQPGLLTEYLKRAWPATLNVKGELNVNERPDFSNLSDEELKRGLEIAEKVVDPTVH
jgi:hypothetical protein